MLSYRISYPTAHHHFLNIELTIENISESELHLQLSAWRPGRYTLQHFAKNIRTFEVEDEKGNSVGFEKKSKDLWRLDTSKADTIKVKYTYYANQMDAGGCYLDEEQVYLNPVCFALEVRERKEEKYSLELDIPDNYQIACALRKENHTLYADSYFELVDSPLIASASLQHKVYQVEESEANFHIWLQGDWTPQNWDKVIKEFEQFTKPQIDLFKDFPSSDYHFLFQILPYKKYHGVEHSHSTVITLGPDYEMENEKEYNDFLGVSSHELFHFWNIMRIRPKEMMPYEFSGENYFRTGFIAEGITTYYGDLMLCRGGAWAEEFYLKELEILLKRHFHNHGRLNLSVADSSYDLWLDGYELGIPNRKSSIYVEGAVAALILDVLIRRQSENERSLDDVMVKLWQDFGKQEKGYTEEDYRKLTQDITQTDLTSYFEKCIYSPNDLTDEIEQALDYLGLELTFEHNEDEVERHLGLKTSFRQDAHHILMYSSESKAAQKLTVGDQIVAIESYQLSSKNADYILKRAAKEGKKDVSISFFRDEKLREVTVELNENEFAIPKISKKEQLSDSQATNLKKWLS